MEGTRPVSFARERAELFLPFDGLGCCGLSLGHVAFSCEGDLYVAQWLDVDVASQGETIDEALANLREAIELRFEDGAPPSVTPPIIAPIEVDLPRAS